MKTVEVNYNTIISMIGGCVMFHNIQPGLTTEAKDRGKLLGAKRLTDTSLIQSHNNVHY